MILRIYCWWIHHNLKQQSWARRHLTKRQKDIFVQYSFSKALLREVIGAGWDQADINNYVLYYNGQVEASLAVPAPGLDMSMKKAINTVIRTKLQAQEEEQEGEQEEEEQEIGLVTPVNPKVPSTGEPPEPSLGLLPPGPRKTVGGKPKPSTSAQLKPKPSAQLVRSSGRIEEGTSKEEGGKAHESGSQVGKEEWPESSKRRSEEALQISAGNCCPEADQAIPEIHRTFDQKVTLPAIGMGNCR